MLKDGLMKENRYRTVDAFSSVWQKHLWLNDCGFCRGHWTSKEPKRASWFKGKLLKAHVWSILMGRKSNLWQEASLAKPGVSARASLSEECVGGERKQGWTVWEECRSIAQTVKLCDKAQLHAHKGAQKDNCRLQKPDNILPGSSQAHHRGHLPIKGPATQAQRSRGAERQARTQIKDFWGTTTLSGSFQGCPSKALAPTSRCDTHHHEDWEQPSGWPFGLRGLLPRGGKYRGMQGKSSSWSHRTYYRMFRRGSKRGTREGFR